MIWPARPSTAASLVGLGPATRPGRLREVAAPPGGGRAEQQRFLLGQVRVDRPDSIQARALGCLPPAVHDQRPQPGAYVIDALSYPAACRRISSIWVARAAPVDTIAVYGGCSRSRPIALPRPLPAR